MKSARALHAETVRRMGGTHAEPGQGDSANLSDALRCSTPNCRNRWSIHNVGDRPWCSPCYAALHAAAKTRQLFPRPPSLEAAPKPGDVDDDPLPF